MTSFILNWLTDRLIKSPKFNKYIDERIEQRLAKLPEPPKPLTEEQVMAFIRGFCTDEQNAPNAAPQAVFSVSCVGLVCTFDASESLDSDGTIVSYVWDFGDDSAPASGETVQHTYDTAGNYVVLLTVTDDKNDTDQDSQIASPTAPVTTVLLDETGIDGTVGSETNYSVVVPEGATRLTIETTGAQDSDLYVKFGSAPTTADYDCWPGNSSSTGNEQCIFVDPPAGTWHIMLHGFTAYNDATLHVEYDTAIQSLTSGVAETFLAGPSGNESVFQISVPSNATELEFFADEQDGEFSMYARYNAIPTSTEFDYSSTAVGGNETITIPNPTAGTWYVMLKAGTVAPNDFYSRVSLTGTVSTTIPTTLQPCTVPGTPYVLTEGKDATNADPDPLQYDTPDKGTYFEDPTYGVCSVRVTDSATEAGGSETFLRSIYSRSQVFNSDDSKMLVYASNGFWHLYNTSDLSYDQQLPGLAGANCEPQWHPSNPNKLRYIPNNGGFVINELDITTGVTTVIADFRNVVSIAGHSGTSILNVWPTAARFNTGAEGSPSTNHQYWTFIAKTSSFQALGAIVYDLVNNTIVGVLDFADIGRGNPNHVDTSPSGDYCIVGWNDGSNNCASGTAGTFANPCGLMAYTKDFSGGVGLMDKAPHGDFAVGIGGTDRYVVQDSGDGLIKMFDPATGTPTTLFDGWEFSTYSTAMHFSGKNHSKEGWILISTYGDRCNQPATGCPDDHWFDKKLFAVELKATPRIYNIAHTYNVTTGGQYFTETHASVNRDFTKVIWNSNWGTGSQDDMEMYLVELPTGTIPAAAP